MTEPTEPSSEEDTSTNTKPTTNFAEENVETFKGSLTLKDRTYTKELENPDSSAFKKLAKEIIQVLWEILKNDKFLVKVEVLSFKEGSIICTFRITVRKESVTAEKLKEALTNASKDANKTGPFTFEEIAVEREENFAEENVETFKGSLTLKDRTYTKELENPDSSAFKELAKEIIQVLWEILKNDKFPVKVEVLSFKEGSIICTFGITVRKESVTAEKLKEALTNASKDANKTGPFTFEEIAVEREEKEGPTQGYAGAKGDKWPMWMIVLTTVCGVLFLLILVMAYLVSTTNY